MLQAVIRASNQTNGQIVPVVVSYSYNICTDTISMQYLAASVTKEPCTYKFHCVHHILRQLARTIYKYFYGLQITIKRDSVLQKKMKAFARMVQQQLLLYLYKHSHAQNILPHAGNK